MLSLSLFSILVCVAAQVIDQRPFANRITGSSFGIPSINATYDYIVVGCGLAGGVVSGRLTENPALSVACIEAGNFYELTNGNWSQIPYYSTKWVSADVDDWQPLIDWGLVSEPQPGWNGRRAHYAQGKNFGGSSGRNQLMFHRGTVGSYALMADRVGDDSYNWTNFLPFYQKTVDFVPHNVSVRAANASVPDTAILNGRSPGPVKVSYDSYAQPISSYMSNAFAEVGVFPQSDFVSGVLNGSGYLQHTTDPATGTRSSSETAFLEAAFARDNFVAYPNAMVHNIIFENGTAVGVNVTTFGLQPYTLRARKEVIVSAGVWHSPQLLMVSGIGPRATLEKYNITVLSDLPGVGQNIHDSASIGGITYKVDLYTSQLTANQTYFNEARQQYNDYGVGPFSTLTSDYWAWEKLPPSARAALANTTRTALERWPADWPEVEYIPHSGAGSDISGNIASTQNYASIVATLTAAISRGNMTIRSDSNDVPPVISPNWLEDPADQQVAVAAYKRLRQVWAGTNITIGEEVSPGTNVTSDADILAYIKNKGVGAIHHGTASCAMGKIGVRDTVVDSKARVLGVKGLRVIDSSSMPFTIPGHTQAATYAHAEKLVVDILQNS